MGQFNPDFVFDACSSYLDDSDPHRSGEASWAAKAEIENLTTNLKKSLHDFISKEVQFPNIDDTVKLPIYPNKNDLYLSFNYTDTLERYYQIHQSQICYIHGKAGINAELQIGHAVEPNSALSIKPTQDAPPQNMTDEQRERWEEYKSDQYSLSTELANDEIDRYWAASFKSAKVNIESNINFFKQLSAINCVTILGHSLSNVDLPYFEELKRTALQSAIWHVSYHSENEREKHRIALHGLGVQPEFVKQASISALLAPN